MSRFAGILMVKWRRHRPDRIIGSELWSLATSPGIERGDQKWNQ